MAGFALVAPATEPEVFAELTSLPAGQVAVVAGGTDLLFDLDDGRTAPRRVVSLRRLPWAGHTWDGGGLTIGSTEPLRALETDPELARNQPALAEAIAAVGSPALRRQATVGGNLGRAAPASDLVPVLLVLDAEVELRSAGGARRLSVDRLVRGSRTTELGPGELIRSIRLPEARPSSAYLWQRVRPAHDISQVGVAVAYAPSAARWRVSLGGAPPRPVLTPEAAAHLTAPEPGPAEVAAACARLAEHPALVGDRRASDEHRRRLAAALLARAVAASVGGSRGAR